MLIFKEWFSNDTQFFKAVFESAKLRFLIFTVDMRTEFKLEQNKFWFIIKQSKNCIDKEWTLLNI